MRASSTQSAEAARRPRLPARLRKLSTPAITHLVLLIGCVVFSLPFYWLLSTSVKETDEIQRDPPVWVPSVPRPAPSSPYIERERAPRPVVPEDTTAEQHARYWPTVEAALWEWVTLEERDPALSRLPQAEVRGTLVNALWEDTQAGTPPDTWLLEPDEIASAIVDGLDNEDFLKAWDRTYRSFGLRELVVEDRGFVRHVIDREFDQMSAWAPICEGETPRRIGGLEKPAVEVAYDLRTRRSQDWAIEVPVDVTPEEFRGIILPVRHDHSWHKVSVTVHVGHRRFEAVEALVLSDRAWLDTTWRLPTENAPGFEVHDFQELREKGEGEAPPGRMRVIVRLHRASALGALWAKWTRSYRDATRYVPFWTLLRNTVWIVVLSIVGQVFACSLVAFSFARLRWPFRDLCFALLLSTMMLPAQVTMIPQFLIFKHLGWYNSLKPLWVPAFFGSAFFIFMLRQFMKGIPTDLEDAAKIDGCSYFGIYWRIMLPLVKPALAAISIFTFMGSWNNFMGPLIYVGDQRLYPLALGLFQFRSEHGAEYGMLMAASAMMTLPVVAIFFAAQRYFIQGVTLTGIKG